MARAIWKGAITFGLVNIPVGVYTAARAHELDLDLLDKRDFSPIGYQRINKSTGKVVERDNIVKGYQYEKGDYVLLNDEDFRRANVEATRTIDIHAFVERASISPHYFEVPYYLGPEKHGEKVYALLRDALEKSGRVGVASVVMHTRQHLAVLMPMEGYLLMNTLRFADEVKPVEDVLPDLKPGKRGAPTPKEMQMALRLIEELSEDFKPERYRDTYHDDLMKRIEEKVAAGQSKTLTRAEGRRKAARDGGKVVDLMELLRKSVDETRTGGAHGKGAASADQDGASKAGTGRRSRYARRRASRTRGRVARRA